MKKNLILQILLSSFIFNSCESTNSVPGIISPVKELIKLKTGNYWVYTVGIKDSYNDTLYTFTDTLKVISETDSGFFLKSSSGLILPDGYYTNRNDGLYSGDKMQFKYPGMAGEYCGEMALGNLINSNGEKPFGIIDRTDYSFTSANFTGGPRLFDKCYYYFLTAFYIVPEIKKTGYTVFKPGIGIVQMDWTDINETINEFYNPYAVLIFYSIAE